MKPLYTIYNTCHFLCNIIISNKYILFYLFKNHRTEKVMQFKIYVASFQKPFKIFIHKEFITTTQTKYVYIF